MQLPQNNSVHVIWFTEFDTKINRVQNPISLLWQITGSTRMKGGSAHKIVLNMIFTCVMIKMRNVCEYLMINVKPTI